MRVRICLYVGSSVVPQQVQSSESIDPGVNFIQPFRNTCCLGHEKSYASRCCEFAVAEHSSDLF